MMNTDLHTKTQTHAQLDEKVDALYASIKKVLTVVGVIFVLAIAFILLIEVKRAYNIDLVDGVNFTVDDWYFSNTGR